MNKQSIDMEALETLGEKLTSSDVSYEQVIGQEILDGINITEESTENNKVLTNQEIELIRNRLSKITPGPWGYFNTHILFLSHGETTCGYCNRTDIPYIKTIDIEPDPRFKGKFQNKAHLHGNKADLQSNWNHIRSLSTYEEITGNYDIEEGGVCSTPEDSEFISCAPTDIERLLVTVESLQNQLNQNLHVAKLEAKLEEFYKLAKDAKSRLSPQSSMLTGPSATFNSMVGLIESLAALDEQTTNSLKG